MGCAQSQQPKRRGMEQLQRSSTVKSTKQKAQQQEDLDSLNSFRPKVMPIVSDEQDYNPRDENYLTFMEPVKLPIQKSGKRVESILGNPLYEIEDSKDMIPDFSKYKVPKITYPKLELSAISMLEKKWRQKPETKEFT